MPQTNVSPKDSYVLAGNLLTHLSAMIDECEKKKEMGEAPDPIFLSEIRLAERTANFLINCIPSVVEGKPIKEFLNSDGEDYWDKLKDLRDEVADRVSTLIEADSAAKMRYAEYCENLKGLRTLGSML